MWAWTQCAGHYIHIRHGNIFLWHVIALPQHFLRKGMLVGLASAARLCAMELCRAQSFGRSLSSPRPSNAQTLEAVSVQLPAVWFSSKRVNFLFWSEQRHDGRCAR